MRRTRVKEGSRIRCCVCSRRHTHHRAANSSLGWVVCGEKTYVASHEGVRVPYGPMCVRPGLRALRARRGKEAP